MCECGGGYIYNQLNLGRDGKLGASVRKLMERSSGMEQQEEEEKEKKKKDGKIPVLFVVVQSIQYSWCVSRKRDCHSTV